jgi:hypothetical protein
VTRATNGLVGTVRDEGSGIDRSMPSEGGGLGLVIMGRQARKVAVESD